MTGYPEVTVVNRPFTQINSVTSRPSTVENTWFLSRLLVECHLNSIGWFDSPYFGTRFRAFASPLLIGAATPSQQNFEATQETMKNTKFVVKVVRGTRVAEYVQRIDRSPVQTTLKRNLALVMGKFTAEDIVNSLGNSRCILELVPVQVTE
jgi:hypothetical protein